MSTLQYRILIAASLFGAAAVLFGALGTHSLRNLLTPEELNSFETGVRFQMYHAIALLGMIPVAGKAKKNIVQLAFYFFIAGIVFFSFSIYLFAGLEIIGTSVNRFLRLLTPLGGLLLIFGWLLLFYTGFRSLYLKRRSE